MRLRSLGLRHASALLGLASACVEPGPAAPASTEASSTGPAPATTATGEPDSTGVTSMTTASTTTAGSTGDASCEPVTVPLPNIERPIGVVLLVDNSAGMGEEAAEVSARLGDLATRLRARAEASFVLISAYPADDPQGVCVDPPLGNGGCPASDHAPPGYVHVDQPVTALDALGLVFVTYAQWALALPENAKRHLVVVSDGDTGVGVSDFRSDFLMLDPEQNAGHRIHVSVAHEACAHASTPGEGFRAHAAASGGWDHDLCTQDYAAFFEGLGDRILANLGDRCRWQLPAVPAGGQLHPDHVEVTIAADDLMTVLSRVGSAAECATTSTGWYWDDPAAPDTMRACPETCALLDGFTTVESTVRFGCPP